VGSTSLDANFYRYLIDLKLWKMLNINLFPPFPPDPSPEGRLSFSNMLMDELLVNALRSGGGIFKEIRESGAYKAALAQTISRLDAATKDLKAELLELQEVIDPVK
jgi:hypothetical protein